MLHVTVELVPGGRLRARRTIASTEIVNVTGGAQPDYRVVLTEQFANGPREGLVRSYPRWSGSVWELVVRSVLSALTGREALPTRLARLDIPVREDGGLRYVRLDDIPQPARDGFESALYGSTIPVVASEVSSCAFAWDWKDFIEGRRNPRSPFEDLATARSRDSEQSETESKGLNERLSRHVVGLQVAMYDASVPLEFLGLYDYRIAASDVGQTIGALVAARVSERVAELERAAGNGDSAPRTS